MKTFLQQQARRIDALSLRERAIMFVSLAAGLVAAADAFVLSPRLAEHKQLLAQRRQQGSAIDALRATLAGGGAATDPAATRLARQLGETRARQQVVDAEVARGLSQGALGARLPELLERVLQRYEGLTLLRLATVAAPAAAARDLQSLPLQSVELAVRGSYPDLARYVADTESALPGLRWGELTVAAADGVPELKARVHLLGATP